jgi:uncharacterized membrane protein
MTSAVLSRPQEATSIRATGPTRRYFARDRTSLFIAGGLALLVFALSIYRHLSLQSTTFDLAVFDQALWKMAHGHSPQVTMIGWNIFADHLSPVLLLFVPLYRIAATPYWLFAAQAIALGAGFLVVRPLLAEVGGERWFAPFAVAYVASPLLWNAALFDFHPTTLAVPFVLVGLVAATRNDRKWLVLSGVALLLLRDDLGLVVAGLALWGITGLPRGERRFRLAMIAVGVLWAIAGAKLGTALGASRHVAYHYGYLYPDGGAAALMHPFATIGRLARGIVRGDNLTLTMSGYLYPLGLFALLRPVKLALLGVLMLPLLASAGSQFHSPQFHYGAPLFGFAFMAAAIGARSIPERIRSPHATVWLIGAALSSQLIAGPTAAHILPRETVSSTDARLALELVRPEDGVATSATLGPHLSQRDLLMPLPFPFVDVQLSFPLSRAVARASAARARDIDVIVFPTAVTKAEQRYLDLIKTSPYLADYEVVGRFKTILVYRRIKP